MKISNEMKAGLVIVAAIAIAILFFTRTANIQASPYDVKTYFMYAGDLKEDATVKLAGIEAGRLKKIEFIYGPETRIECILALNYGIKVRKDSIAYIATSGIVGDSYVGLTPGKSADFLKPGATVASEDPVQMRELMKKADEISENLDIILLEAKSFVVDNRQGLDGIVDNLEATTQNFKEFSEDVKKHPWKLLFKGE